MKYIDSKNAGTNLINAFVTLTLAVLGLRVVFSLLDADTTNSLVRWVYSTSEPLMSPFRNVFSEYAGSDAHVLELPVLFAMAAYAVVGVVALGFVARTSKSKR